VAFFWTKQFAPYSKRAKAVTGGDPAAVRLYSDRVLATPVDPLGDFYPRPTGPDVIDLNLVAPRFESPVSAGRLTADRLAPPPGWGLPELRESVAERFGEKPENVLVTRGASGAFAAVLDAFVNPGDPVVVCDPGPPMFTLGAVSRRARVRRIPAAWDRAAFRKAVADAKLVAVAVPNNPTGQVPSDEAMRMLVEDTERAGAILYLDSTFDPDVPLPSGHRILRAGSASALGLSGLRVGWLAGPPGLLRPCALAQAMAGPFVPTVCQQVAARVLADRESWTNQRDSLAARRTWAAERLNAYGWVVEAGGTGPFLWANVSNTKLTGRQIADRLLSDFQVMVGPGDLYGPSGTNFVRLSVAADDGRLREGLARIEAFVQKLTGRTRVSEARVRMEAIKEERQPVFSRS
jgi:aspartate/methionine/tyrosine aminotransferase